MSTKTNMQSLASTLKNLEAKSQYDVEKYTTALLQQTKELEFFYCNKAKGKDPDSTFYYLNIRPKVHTLAYFNLSRGYPKEIMDGHWCYVLKDFGVKMLVIPCTSLKDDSSHVRPQFQKDITIQCENHELEVRMQISDLRCLDVQRLDDRKPFYEVKTSKKEIEQFVFERLFDNSSLMK